MTLYEKVRIKSTGETGIIVDIIDIDGKASFTVEDDKTDEHDNLILHDCYEGELEKLN